MTAAGFPPGARNIRAVHQDRAVPPSCQDLTCRAGTWKRVGASAQLGTV